MKKANAAYLQYLKCFLLILAFAEVAEAQLSRFVQNVEICARQSGPYDLNACSLAVREITECAGRGTGWCSGSAVNYNNCPYSCNRVNNKDCNDQFDQNWTKISAKAKECLREGSLRVYIGPCDRFKYYEGTLPKNQIRQKRAQCLNQLKVLGHVGRNAQDRDILPGDFHGHIEIVGQGGRSFHHYESTPYPIDSPFELGTRRTLIGCFLPKL